MALDRIWLEVHVAEAHAAELTDVRGVWFEVEGFVAPFEAGIESVVTAGGVLDVRSRTVPLFVEIPNPGGRLRVGMFADAHVLTGEPRQAVAVPHDAVMLEGGSSVVYVQTGGESFERRAVRLGVRDGPVVEIVEGLEEGERVVTRGVYAVRLASSASSAPAHAHHH